MGRRWNTTVVVYHLFAIDDWLPTNTVKGQHGVTLHLNHSGNLLLLMHTSTPASTGKNAVV